MATQFRPGHVPAPAQVESPVPLVPGQPAAVPLASQLNFEQRVLYPSMSPAIPVGKDVATHQMAWNDQDNLFTAFPTIVQTPSGNLISLSPADAERYAQQTGELRKFNTAKEAKEYAEGGYKQSWGAGDAALLQALKKIGVDRAPD